MDWAMIIAPLIQPLTDLVKNVIESTKGNDEAAVEALTKILGSTDENKLRAALVIANAKAMKEFSVELT